MIVNTVFTNAKAVAQVSVTLDAAFVRMTSQKTISCMIFPLSGLFRRHKGLKRPVTLPIQVLHQMFGRDIKQLKHFVPEFKRALIDAHKWYPTARVELLKDNSGLVLKDSPALIPYKKLARLS